MAGVITLMAAGAVQAQIIGNLDVGNTIAVTNALGQNLPGSWGSPATACRVEVREVLLAIVPPDPVTGAGNDTLNPLVKVSFLGENVIGTDTGMFSTSISNRMVVGSNYYVRVYDAPQVGDAIYYGNTAAFAGPPGGVPTVTVEFQPLQLVSGEPDVDTDSDGIPNAMEDGNVYSTDSNNPDTDGDGYPDGFEVAHETYLQPTEPDPNDIRVETEELTGDRWAAWWSIPDVGYRLEYTDAMTDPEVFVDIWNGTAAGTNLEVDVEDYWMTNAPKGFFRWAIP